MTDTRDGGVRHLYPPHGLIELGRCFRQTPLSTMGRPATRHVLRTPSGDQWTIDALEGDLLEQLAFMPETFDVMCRPVVRYPRGGGREGKRTFGFALQTFSPGPDARFLIDIGPQEPPTPAGTAAAARRYGGLRAADSANARLVVLDERAVRTPYLANARRFRRRLAEDLDGEDCDPARRTASAGPIAFGSLVDRLTADGVDRSAALATVERLVAFRMLACDLSVAVDDGTLLTLRRHADDPGHFDDPMMKLLSHAASP